MRKSTSINLELIKGEDGGVKFYAKQFDDLKLNIKVYDGLEEVNVDGQDIIVCIIKEDKTVIEQTKDITVEDNTIVARLSKQATTALGKCSMEVLLRDEEGTASTTTISYMVSEKLSASIVEMIKSEDDINALNLIEEFIETSNVDMLDIKEAIKDLKATVDGAQDSIDAEYETILEALRALEGTIIENIEGKANEALTIADEAVEKATGAINKADEVLVKVEEVKGVVGEITTLKNEAVGAIGAIKTEAIDEVNNTKTRAIGDIDEARTDSLEAIRNNGNGVANDLNTLSDTLKADITNTGLLETNKVIRAREEALTEIDDLKDNAMGSLGEEALKVEELLNATVTEVKEQAETDLRASSRAITEESKENIGTIKDSAINEINGVKDDLGAYKDEVIEEAVKGKEEAIKELNDASNALNNLKATILNDINTNKEEAINNIGTIKDNANNELNENKAGAINELNEVKAEALVDINNLKNEVDTLLNSLNEKVVESNGNIEELTGLIEEAREVAGLVRAFIDSKAVDLSNYYTREETESLINEKIGLIEIPEVDLTNYYTKVEVDKKINNYKGEIGYSEYKIKPEGFDEAFKRLLENPKAIYPNMKGNVVGYIQGTISRQTNTNSSGTRLPGVILFTDYNNIYNTLRPTITNSTAINREFDIVQLKTMSGGTVSSSNRSNMSYPCIIDSETGEFIEGYMPSSSYHFTITDYYYSTVDIYNSDNTIAYSKCEGELPLKYNDCNNAIEEGNYKVNIKEGEVVENMPTEGIFKGILIVDKANEVISQELITENNVVYRRVFINNTWSEWKSGGGSDIDLSSYSTTEEVRSLINESIGVVRASLIGDINDIIGGI